MQPKEIIKNIKQIYDDYCVPMNVRRHMIWVTNVAEMICDNSKVKVDKDAIVAACLLHDMGNIIKINFDSKENLAMLCKEDQARVEELIKKREEMREKFGHNAEHANLLIGKELGVSKKVELLLEHRPYKIEGGKLATNNLEELISAYADLRVDPNGIVSMKERMGEYAKRYKIHADKEKAEYSEKFTPLAYEMEKEIFSKIKIKPEDINLESTKKYFEKYKGVI